MSESQFVIAELADDAEGGFAPRGAVKKLWETRDFETLVAGPAETGKTWGSLQYLDALLWKYPNAQAVMCRKVYATLNGTCVRTYKRILGPDSPVKAYGGESPQWFDYPNGSRLWLAGMDNPGKALSSERDLIYVNQAEELTLTDWETLTTRCTGRGSVMPYTRMIGDANPGPPQHWIKKREAKGSLRLLESRHQDNPTLYSESEQITPQGVRTMSILDALTGIRKLRLRFGKWAAAEGAVYEGFDAAIHLIDAFKIPDDWRRIRVVDFGYTNPFVCQWWAIDPDGRMWMYREIYFSRRIVEEHSTMINNLSQGERIETTVADHDAEDRATLARYGIQTIPANKSVSTGIEAVAARLRKAGDGKPRLFIFKNATVERDERLIESKLPTSTEQEIGEYSYPIGVDGKTVKEAPVKVNDHGVDAMRYAVAFIDDLKGMTAWSDEALASVLANNGTGDSEESDIEARVLRMALSR